MVGNHTLNVLTYPQGESILHKAPNREKLISEIIILNLDGMQEIR